MSNLNIFKEALADRKAATETIATPSGYHALLNAIKERIEVGQKYLNSSKYTNPDGSFKIVNGSQEGACVALLMERGHSEESATRMANAILNGGVGSGQKGHTTLSDDAFDKIKAAGGKNVRTTENSIEYDSPSGNPRGLAHRMRGDGHRYVDTSVLKEHLKWLPGKVANAILNAETDNTCLPGTLNGLATASGKAADASEAAERTGTASDHFAAKNAHEHAGNLAARLGDTENASHHAKKASEHQKKGEDAYPKGQTDKKHAGSPK